MVLTERKCASSRLPKNQATLSPEWRQDNDPPVPEARLSERPTQSVPGVAFVVFDLVGLEKRKELLLKRSPSLREEIRTAPLLCSGGGKNPRRKSGGGLRRARNDPAGVLDWARLDQVILLSSSETVWQESSYTCERVLRRGRCGAEAKSA